MGFGLRQQGNIMTKLSNDICELNLDELDAVSGGNLVDAAVEAVKVAARIITDNAGKCTDHWYSN
jgi:hypothetical protein